MTVWVQCQQHLKKDKASFAIRILIFVVFNLDFWLFDWYSSDGHGYARERLGKWQQTDLRSWNSDNDTRGGHRLRLAIMASHWRCRDGLAVGNGQRWSATMKLTEFSNLRSTRVNNSRKCCKSTCQQSVATGRGTQKLRNALAVLLSYRTLSLVYRSKTGRSCKLLPNRCASAASFVSSSMTFPRLNKPADLTFKWRSKELQIIESAL